MKNKIGWNKAVNNERKHWDNRLKFKTNRKINNKVLNENKQEVKKRNEKKEIRKKERLREREGEREIKISFFSQIRRITSWAST